MPRWLKIVLVVAGSVTLFVAILCGALVESRAPGRLE